jgi:hypothetical protein
MLARCVFLTALALATAAGTAAQTPAIPSAATPVGSEFDSASFAAEMTRWDELLVKLKQQPEEASHLVAQVPAAWHVRERVSNPEQSYDISAAWLRDGLVRINPKNKASGSQIEDLRKRILALKQLAESPALAGATSDDAENTLKRILERREFRPARPPGPLEVWADRMKTKVGEWIAGLLEGISRHPQAAKTIVWVLIIGAVILLGVLLYRTLYVESRREELDLGEPLPPARSWRDWLHDAMSAASQGDFRKAMRAAYWAGVMRLEEMGAWSPDRTRTPREYLRLLGVQDARRHPLGELTRRFEVTWYGYAQASSKDYAEALHHLEGLGCRLPSNPAIAKS